MNELIKITEQNGQKAVSARELYDFLGFNATHWKRWYTKNIINNPYAQENEDYVGFATMANGNETQDFALSIDFAKRLTMLARTEKGEQARQYFIKCEKQLQEIRKPLSQLEIIAQSAQILLEHDSRLGTVENKVKELQAKTQTRPDYFTIAGFATLNKMKATINLCRIIGTKASRICKLRDIPIDKCPDPRFGEVNMYPREVLEEVFAQPIN